MAKNFKQEGDTLTLTALPTKSGATGVVYNDGGTLKISS